MLAASVRCFVRKLMDVLFRSGMSRRLRMRYPNSSRNRIVANGWWVKRMSEQGISHRISMRGWRDRERYGDWRTTVRCQTYGLTDLRTYRPVIVLLGNGRRCLLGALFFFVDFLFSCFGRHWDQIGSGDFLHSFVVGLKGEGIRLRMSSVAHPRIDLRDFY